VPHLVAAPDKFRGTATAQAAAAAIAAAAEAAGWTCTARPMSDGGEGFLDALGGSARTTTVRGPLGERVEARWALLDDGTALVESAEAAGRALLPRPRGDDPLAASTYGVGELVAAALGARPTALVVGCGGTATTDGGAGCVAALDDLGVTVRVPLLVACDVDVRFVEAAPRFAPQKGASPEQVALLATRLREVADRYRARFGVDVTDVTGAGAAGGLAGALIALGGEVAAGSRYVAARVGLAEAVGTADLVVTGEGRVDTGTLEGKVVAVVLGLHDDVTGLVVAGAVDDDVARVLAQGRRGDVEVVTLDAAVQRARGTGAAITEAVATRLRSWTPR
jgi:glycerate kinase